MDLATLDGKLLDGLDFCGKVYDLFDKVRGGPGGIAKLRPRPTKTEKRLVEELIPIARYVHSRYREGRRINIRWFRGSQPYDAIIWSRGSLVEHRFAPRKLFVEVTTSVHQNEYLARQLLHQRGGSFGVKGISRDRKTGEIASKPHVFTPHELATDLGSQILQRLKNKSTKNYPAGTVLIINCVTNSVMLEAEWNAAVGRVIAAQANIDFLEVFVLDSLTSRSTTLHASVSG